jgi:hypothetical protein
MSQDLNFQNYSTVQNNQQPSPNTVASASAIAMPQTFMTIITGTTAIATIPPPVTGQHMLILVFTDANPGGVTTGGNIVAAVDPAQYAPILLFYNPATALYYAGKLAVG